MGSINAMRQARLARTRDEGKSSLRLRASGTEPHGEGYVRDLGAGGALAGWTAGWAVCVDGGGVRGHRSLGTTSTTADID